MGSPIISQQKILAASQGDANALRDVLNQLSTANATTMAVTGTTPTAAPIAGQPSPAAPIPPQATGTVSVLANNYIVQIVNPGASSAVSQLQAAQAAGNATFLTPLQPVKAIYHQIRASTSPAFNVNSNTQMFGGNTGSAQVYWSLTGLGTGTWYFQFRSSYDGINFNTWKNVNGGAALGELINQVTEENVGDVNWALFSLPGGIIAGIGSGYCFDGEIFELATQLYSSGMVAVASPNGIAAHNQAIYGMALSDVDLQTPASGGAPETGIADYPVVIRDTYAIYGGLTQFPGNASVFAIAVDPSNANVTIYTENGGTPTTSSVWMAVKLPGGAQIAIGQGRNNDGDTIWTPPGLTWLTGANMMSICALTGWLVASGNTIQGWNKNQMNVLALEASYLDYYGSVISTQGNWMAVAWQPGTPIVSVAGVNWLKINLQGGHAVYLGAGQIASGTPITLPAGCTVGKMLSICTPGGNGATGGSIWGVQECAMTGLTPVLSYSGVTGGTAPPVNWMVCAWV